MSLWHASFFLSPAWGMSRRTLPPYFFLCGPPPGLDHCLSKLAAATGEKMMCGKCIHSYRFQIVLLKADKECQVIKSSVPVCFSVCLSHFADEETEALRGDVAAELRRASWGQNPVSQASDFPTRLADPLPRAQDSFSVQHGSS